MPAACPAALALALGFGGPPQVAAEGRLVLTSPATAVSERSREWLESNEELIEKRRLESHRSDTECATLYGRRLEGKERRLGANESDDSALRKFQTPTAENLRNVEQRELSSERGVPRSVLELEEAGAFPMLIFPTNPEQLP